MPIPPGLRVTVRDGDGPTVILVHGSLDRSESFTRTLRRLPDFNLVTFDRRGYAGSRSLGPAHTFDQHLDDLLAVAATFGAHHAVGHSVGGDVVLGASIRTPHAFTAIGAYEPPMPWIHPPADRRPLTDDVNAETERFFRRMVGDETWERLGDDARRERYADGPALLADLRMMRGPAPFEITTLHTPVIFGRGEFAREHHRDGVAWLVDHVAQAQLFIVPGAGHGAHLSHPDGFAAMVRRTLTP